MNKKLKGAIAMTAMIFFICAAVYVLMPKESKPFMIITDSLLVVFSGAAFIGAFFTSKVFGWKSKEGKVWLFLALGYFLLALGEFFWMFNEAILQIKPFPSVADVFYLLAYLPLIAGLLVEYGIIKEIIQKKETEKATLLTILIVTVSTFLVILPIATATDYDLMSKAISLFYPIGDLVIIFPALLFFFVFKRAKSPGYWLMSRPWMIIAISLIFLTMADLSFAYLDWNGLYTGIPRALTDLAWIANYLLFALGAYYHRIIAKGEIR